MISLKINGKRLAILSLVATLLFFIAIGKENRALEFYGDNIKLPVDETRNEENNEEKEYFYPFTEETSTYFTTLTTMKKIDNCNDDQIMLYLADIQVINPETIVQIASYKNFGPVCRKVGATLESIDAWMLTCNPLPASNFYMKLTAGVRVLYNKLCSQSDYQPEFKKYITCFRELHNEYIDCTGPAAWIIDMKDQELCRQYKAIVDCYYTQTAMFCGLRAAKTLKELVMRVINAVIQVDCPEVEQNPPVPDPVPEHSIYARKSKTSKIRANFALGTLLLLFLITYC